MSFSKVMRCVWNLPAHRSRNLHTQMPCHRNKIQSQNLPHISTRSQFIVFHQNLKISSLQKRAPEQNVVELDIAVIGLILASPLHEVDELGLAVDVHGGELVGVLGDKVLRVECLDTKWHSSGECPSCQHPSLLPPLRPRHKSCLPLLKGGTVQEIDISPKNGSVWSDH